MDRGECGGQFRSVMGKGDVSLSLSAAVVCVYRLTYSVNFENIRSTETLVRIKADFQRWERLTSKFSRFSWIVK